MLTFSFTSHSMTLKIIKTMSQGSGNSSSTEYSLSYSTSQLSSHLISIYLFESYQSEAVSYSWGSMLANWPPSPKSWSIFLSLQPSLWISLGLQYSIWRASEQYKCFVRSIRMQINQAKSLASLQLFSDFLWFLDTPYPMAASDQSHSGHIW